MMPPALPSTLERASRRVIEWFQVHEPVTYRDAWRYSLGFVVLLVPYAGLQAAIGNEAWPVLLMSIGPAMGSFTFGFASRQGTGRQRWLSASVVALTGGTPLLIPQLRALIGAVEVLSLLMAWLLLLVALFGYAFPEYGPAVTGEGADGGAGSADR